MPQLTQLPQWQALHAHHAHVSRQSLKKLFQQDPHRFNEFSLSVADIWLDYSKNHITIETRQLLTALAEAVELPNQIHALFSGTTVNTTEQLPALHTALRQPQLPSLMVDGINIMDDIRANLRQMHSWVDAIHNNHWRGYSGLPFTDIVNIGIGGSHLGPLMANHALRYYQKTPLRYHFIANSDGALLSQILPQLNPATTLFILSSKSFNSIETLYNAHTLRTWFHQQTPPQTSLDAHFCAVTNQIDQALEFGVARHRILYLWRWVGGRYSLWSAISLTLALLIGMENFYQLLQGAHAMDQHFRTTPLTHNMPVILALLGIWYVNFFNTQTRAVLVYDDTLCYLPAYLQQLEMESNGKSIGLDGTAINYSTCPIVFGDLGLNGQHAFYQLLHQGTACVPADFIIPLRSHHPLAEHHALSVASALSQSRALMEGHINTPAYKVLPGNHPSNSLVLRQLTPMTLGALIALYEHKVFVQSIIWQINAFDQWGVVYGKQLTHQILTSLRTKGPATTYDASTNSLIGLYHACTGNRSHSP